MCSKLPEFDIFLAMSEKKNERKSYTIAKHPAETFCIVTYFRLQFGLMVVVVVMNR